jgi:hypothetical protein
MVEDGATPEAPRRPNFVFFDDPARIEEGAGKLEEACRPTSVNT